MSDSIASRYYIVLRDQTYVRVATFDLWTELTYKSIVNDVGYASLVLHSDDERRELFELDGLIEIYRSMPGLGVDWYREFVGLCRATNDSISETGDRQFTVTFLGLNDFLARTIINYKEGTIKAYKNDVAETVMKEYVEENCGATALTVVPYEREVDGVLPDFYVAPTSGYGIVWEGDRAFEGLLDTLQSIAKLSAIDFNVEWDLDAERFWFRTYENQLGSDRTNVGLDPSTGLNSSGNVPVVFSLANGTLQNLDYAYDRTAESNVVSVLGDGDGSTRIVVIRSTTKQVDSPWNRREVARPANGFISQMEIAGDEVLEELSAKETISFKVLQQASQAYGKHYFLGDRVTIIYKGISFQRRLTEIEDNTSEIIASFSDY